MRPSLQFIEVNKDTYILKGYVVVTKFFFLNLLSKLGKSEEERLARGDLI